MSNNYMIVEVWEKRAAGQKDQVSEVFTECWTNEVKTQIFPNIHLHYNKV